MKGKRKKFSTAKPYKRKPKFKSKFKPKFSKFRKTHKKTSKNLQTHNLTKLTKNPAHPQQHATKPQIQQKPIKSPKIQHTCKSPQT